MRHSLGHADIEALAGAAHGFVGADLSALVDEAALYALRRAVAGASQGRQPEVRMLAAAGGRNVGSG